MKIAILSMCIGERYQKIWKTAIASKRLYCDRNKYDFIYIDNILDKERTPHWSKIKGLQANLKNYDWIFYSDADAHIMNYDMRLEEVIDANSNNNTFLIITKDRCEVNSGNFLIKNCEMSMDFLRDVYAEFPTKPVNIGKYTVNWNDQYGVYNTYTKPKYKADIRFIKQRIINAYPCSCCGEKYQAGDFLIHFVNTIRSLHNWSGESEEPFKEIELAETKTQLYHMHNHARGLNQNNIMLQQQVEKLKALLLKNIQKEQKQR